MRRLPAPLAAVATLLIGASVAAAQPVAGAQRALQKSLSGSLASVGGASGALVVDRTTGQALYSAGPDAGRLPASVEKIYTTSTALLRFGPGATLSTQVWGTGSADPSGGWHGTLYLKGGGDPTFGSSSFDSTAYGTGATMQRLVSNFVERTRITSVQGRIVGDESYFDSLRGTIATGYQPDSLVEGLLSGLAYDRGFANFEGTAFQSRPALFATQSFAGGLRAAHVSVGAKTPILTGRTPPTAQLLASVSSPRMARMIQLTNAPSDNYLAEMLLKGIGARFGGSGTSAAGAAVVRSELADQFGIHPRLDDGSGLSRDDHTTPRDVVKVLSALSSNQPFVNSLAVAGGSGTLYALAGTFAQNRCRGKTGTLHDVADEVGYCTARDGHKLVFAFLMNSVDPSAGHATEDRMTVSLASYNG